MRSKHLRVEVAGFTINDYRINKAISHFECLILAVVPTLAHAVRGSS